MNVTMGPTVPIAMLKAGSRPALRADLSVSFVARSDGTVYFMGVHN